MKSGVAEMAGTRKDNALKSKSGSSPQRTAPSRRALSSSGQALRKEPLPPGAVHPRNTLNDLDSKSWVKHTKSWFVADGRRAQITRDIESHPASYPPEVAERFIRLFTKAGGTVLDPFAGCGSTVQAAMDQGRRAYGIELSLQFCEIMDRRFQSVEAGSDGFHRPVIHHSDSRLASELDLPPIDLVMTSPPYWDMLKQSRGNVRSAQSIRREKGLMQDYGDDVRDLGNIGDYQDYLDSMTEVLAGLQPLMKPGAHMVVVIQNVREKSGIMRPVAWDIGARLASVFLLRQEFIWCQDQKRLGCWGYPTTYVSNLHHHYCLIFQKEKS
ncbi:MAG: hypothetical protein CVV64_01070 [Candidatus Wallbacteria bacterium HGW-Wallbacteria-1]|jgi:DNA modification methylase|uniref:Methyltransferase n=1 Tax=Candidatus Wallbacteria bacterium HGW-Wallbacteria-1 TaxID=2013854 RepID=A0A2N1PUM2_9BACT|nr:MAG: hypothetical protein CVV64_01070 [Candidatus Wallbacteria bacterium HGW-Wallbacteria-1]